MLVPRFSVVVPVVKNPFEPFNVASSTKNGFNPPVWSEILPPVPPDVQMLAPTQDEVVLLKSVSVILKFPPVLTRVTFPPWVALEASIALTTTSPTGSRVTSPALIEPLELRIPTSIAVDALMNISPPVCAVVVIFPVDI